MFERYTEKSRLVIQKAAEEARSLNHHYIGTEHLLLGMLTDGDSLAARALKQLDVKYEPTRARIVVIVGVGEDPPEGQPPWTPRAKRVLEQSLRQALTLGHNYVGTEHLLLGLVHEHDGVGFRLLTEQLGKRAQEKVHETVIGLLMPPTMPMPPTMMAGSIDVGEVAPADQAREERKQNRFEPFAPAERALLGLALVSLPTLALLADDDGDKAGEILLDVIPLVNELAALSGTGPVDEARVQQLRDLVGK